MTTKNIQIIDPAYTESDCSFCGGRGQVATSGDPDDLGLEECPGCDGDGVCERCPCGSRVPMTFVPDAYGVRHCGCSPECGEPPLTEAELAAARAEMAEYLETEGRRLLNGGGAHPDDEDETVEVAVESMDEMVFGRRGAAA